MIDQIGRKLQAWVKSVVVEDDVVLGPPRQLEGRRGVSLYLLALANPPSMWMNRQPAIRVALRYLITTWAESDEEAHRLLGNLIVAVLEKREYELDLTEIPANLWAAFGIAPRPAIALCVPLSIPQPEPAIPLVQGPLVIQSASLASLYGIVLGPGDIPISGARVELPALQLRERTNTRGRFFFASVPRESYDLQLLVTAKGHVQQVTVKQSTSASEPLAIRFDSFDKK